MENPQAATTAQQIETPVSGAESPTPSKSLTIDTAGSSHRDVEASDSEKVRIERLGRERPTAFTSVVSEIGFCYSLIASQFIAVGLVKDYQNSKCSSMV